MKRSKMILLIGAVVVIAAGVVGGSLWAKQKNSGQKNVTNTSSSGETDKVYEASLYGGSYNDEGRLYDQEGLIYFWDAKTDKTGVVCRKANCEHVSYSSHADSECDAAFPETGAVFALEDHLYLFGQVTKDTDSSFPDYTLYRAKKDGSGRQKIAAIADSKQRTYTVLKYDRDYIVMQYIQNYAQEDANGNQSGKDEVAFGYTVYSLKDGKIYEITLDKQDLSRILSHVSFTIQKDVLYMSYLGYDNTYDKKEAASLKKKQAEEYDTQHEKVVIVSQKIGTGDTQQVNEVNAYEALLDGNRMAYRTLDGIYVKKDTDKGEGKQIVSVDDKKKSRDTITFFGFKGKYLCYSLSNGSDSTDICIYDMEKGDYKTIKAKDMAFGALTDTTLYLLGGGTDAKAYVLKDLWN